MMNTITTNVSVPFRGYVVVIRQGDMNMNTITVSVPFRGYVVVIMTSAEFASAVEE